MEVLWVSKKKGGEGKVLETCLSGCGDTGFRPVSLTRPGGCPAAVELCISFAEGGGGGIAQRPGVEV